MCGIALSLSLSSQLPVELGRDKSVVATWRREEYAHFCFRWLAVVALTFICTIRQML